MSYYALTINGTMITGVHSSTAEYTASTFENSPRFAGDEVRVIAAPADYTMWTDIRCYEEDGTARDPVWCIQQGYMELPPGFEIIEGELVETLIPEAEASPTLLKRVERAEQANAVEASAARVVFIALAQAGTVTEEQALAHQTLFPQWAEHNGKRAEAGSYWQYEAGLYHVKTAHTLSTQWAPGVATAALFERVQPEGAVEVWKSGQSYAKGVHVMHQSKTWESMVADNVWEPGAPGVHETIWKEAKG